MIKRDKRKIKEYSQYDIKHVYTGNCKNGKNEPYINSQKSIDERFQSDIEKYITIRHNNTSFLRTQENLTLKVLKSH